MEIEIEYIDEENLECLKDQIFFDEKGLGANHDEIIVMFLRDIFEM